MPDVPDWRQFEGRVLARRYHLHELIGKGAMGAVFRAEDSQLVRDVAVKIAAKSATDAAQTRRARARFAREAKSAAAIRDNTNVVVVHDWGDDQGVDYLVMELLEGCNLTEWRIANPYAPLSVRLSIVRQVALGLAAGHAASVIHRDVKPSNLVILPNGGGDVRVKLVDFGIAKPLDPPWTLEDITQDGAFVGTLLYASPEQMRGDGGLTPACDVFSLGVIAYELITGRHPFTADDRVRLYNRSPVHVPSPQRRVPELPDAVAEFVSRALSVDPRERPGSADELAGAIAAAQGASAHDPAPRNHAPSGRLRQRLTAMGRRLRGTAPALGRAGRHAAVGLAVLVTAGGIVYTTWDPTGGTDVKISGDWRPPTVTPQARAAARNANDAGLASIDRQDMGGAVRQFRRAVQLHPDHQEYMDNLAYGLRKQGHYTEAVALLETVVQRYPDRVSAHYNLAEAYVGLGDTTSAIKHLRHYIRRAEPVPAAKGRVRLAELRRGRS